ncbi:MAG: DNA/RNA non-specific endonuclease [Bacteroidales bacterium]|nr:DNA/RNA non-specific endonuclease [Bacteroidales bacterium]MBP3254764.1 DNA/RNA non-specific endonuclease [Bacteroidales bacterium]
MKKYVISVIFLLFVAITAALGLKGRVLSESTVENVHSVRQDTQEVQDNATDSIDIPLPLQDVSEQILYRKGYIVSYNKDLKIPNWVAWHLTAAHVAGEVKRPKNAWHEDIQVPLPRATDGDYRNNGWTRGHMCPAGDNKWNAQAMYESFLFTNACPQNANLNSGDWHEIEKACRRWAEKYGDIYIVCGPVLFRQQHETVGQNQVVVPEAFFKVIVRFNPTPKGIGFICRNTDGNRKKDFYVNTINQTERITGIKFFPSLSGEIAAQVKDAADIKDWE